jgi:hypothetical protein
MMEVDDDGGVLTEFDRRHITEVEGQWQGYPFLPDDDVEGGGVADPYPVPIPHSTRWPGRDEFELRLTKIQEKLRPESYLGVSRCSICNADLSVRTYTGKEMRRTAGNVREEVCWSAHFLSHYVQKHNVKPSLEFYNWVMTQRI